MWLLIPLIVVGFVFGYFRLAARSKQRPQNNARVAQTNQTTVSTHTWRWVHTHLRGIIRFIAGGTALIVLWLLLGDYLPAEWLRVITEYWLIILLIIALGVLYLTFRKKTVTTKSKGGVGGSFFGLALIALIIGFLCYRGGGIPTFSTSGCTEKAATWVNGTLVRLCHAGAEKPHHLPPLNNGEAMVIVAQVTESDLGWRRLEGEAHDFATQQLGKLHHPRPEVEVKLYASFGAPDGVPLTACAPVPGWSFPKVTSRGLKIVTMAPGMWYVLPISAEREPTLVYNMVGQQGSVYVIAGERDNVVRMYPRGCFPPP